MKYSESLILNIKEKIKKFLEEKKFRDFTPIDEAFTDPTRRTYYSIITDQYGQRFFLKIRALDLDFDKHSFEKQLAIGKILKENPGLELNKYTPKLVDGNTGEIDYLLYEYIEGENMGSREGYAVSKFTIKDVDEIIQILQALLTFPVSLLPPDFEKREREYYQKFLEYGTHNTPPQKDIDWDLIENELKYLSHGDFKPVNFIKTKNGLMLVDFEQASISNPYADVIRLWATIIHDQEFKKNLLKEFLVKVKFEKNEKLLKDMMLIHATFERNYLKFKFPELVDKYLKLREEAIVNIFVFFDHNI